MTAASATARRGGGDAATRTRPRFTARAAILAVIVVALLFYLVVPLKAFMAQRSRLGRLDHQMELLQRQNTDLERRVAQLRDPSYLERYARECLGMVKPGEISFVVVPKGGAPAPANCQP
jgi:cell division protein FtsB